MSTSERETDHSISFYQTLPSLLPQSTRIIGSSPELCDSNLVERPISRVWGFGTSALSSAPRLKHPPAGRRHTGDGPVNERHKSWGQSKPDHWFGRSSQHPWLCLVSCRRLAHRGIQQGIRQQAELLKEVKEVKANWNSLSKNNF